MIARARVAISCVGSDLTPCACGRSRASIRCSSPTGCQSFGRNRCRMVFTLSTSVVRQSWSPSSNKLSLSHPGPKASQRPATRTCERTIPPAPVRGSSWRPLMSETLGSLVDKLTIANVRLWHLEDQRRDLTLSDAKRLEAADQVAVVNRQRNDLINEIDQFLADAVSGKKKKLVDPKVKLYRIDPEVAQRRIAQLYVERNRRYETLPQARLILNLGAGSGSFARTTSTRTRSSSTWIEMSRWLATPRTGRSTRASPALRRSTRTVAASTSRGSFWSG